MNNHELSRRDELRLRIEDLKDRMEYLNEISEEKYNYISCGMLDRCFSDEDLQVLEPAEFYLASDLNKAIALAEQELDAEELSNYVFHITPAYAIEHDIQDDCQYIIVSSGDRYDELAEKPNVLLLHFADTEVASHPYAICESDVKAIFEFLEKSDSKEVFCACDAGESRSAAIAASLMKCAGQDDSCIWHSKEYHPNNLVYNTILKHYSMTSDVRYNSH